MNTVTTDKDKCKGCYACIRGCPAKAIKVEEGKAQVIEERCISCGNCLKACVTGAKQVESDVELVGKLLKDYPSVIAVVSSSFPAALPSIKPGQLATALRKLGFSEVMEDAFGAEMVCREYHRILNHHNSGPLLSTSCPAVVNYVEKYHPELVPNLAPIVSTSIAMGRLIKQKIYPQAKVVYIGPCLANKAESRDEQLGRAIDAVLVFAELKAMLAAKGINVEQEEEGVFSGPQPYLGRLFAVSGGLLKVMGLDDDILINNVINAHGKEYVVKILKEISQHNVTARLVSLSFCHGCIDGPAIDNELSGFRRRKLIADYTLNLAKPEQAEKDLRQYRDINLSRTFLSKQLTFSEQKEAGITENEINISSTLYMPCEEDIQRVLNQIDRAKQTDQFNCGACGYSTCRELATAICQGLGEVKMCWPYLLQELQTTQQEFLSQAEKLAAIGQMTAAIAHELNNSLGGVLVYMDLFHKKLLNSSLSKEIALSQLSKMETELTRSTKVIRNLLGFARQSPIVMEEIDLNDVVMRALELSLHTAEMQGIKVVKEFDPFLPRIMADFDQLQQVCTNLILNSIQAMAKGGTMTLETSSDVGEVRVKVQDTGVGITVANIPKLATPFFTTKGKGIGVGLGLPTVYAIVQRHHGNVEVLSKEGEGTSFIVHLPLHYEEKN